MENRRRFPRIDRTLQVKYYPPEKENKFSYTVTRDISRGGICMPAVSDIVRSGDVIRLDINGGDGGNRIMATGRVRWVKALARKALLDEDAGIEFVDIAPADIDRLVKVR